MELKDTVKLMLSADFKQRFQIEGIELIMDLKRG